MNNQPGCAAHEATARAVSLERMLASVLHETAEDLAHAECFDPEQRSELYAIIEALRADSELHQQWLGQWVSDRPAEGEHRHVG